MARGWVIVRCPFLDGDSGCRRDGDEAWLSDETAVGLGSCLVLEQGFYV